MIYKWPCFVTVFLIILLHHLTKQHYMPPPDFCAFAKTCNHTGASICGIERKNLITRLFLDDCDLFEYNCNHQEDYIKTDTEKCPSNKTVLKSIIASTTSTTFNLNISAIEATNMTENNSEIVNTTVVESSTKPATETVITTSLQTNSSLNITKPKVTCIWPTVTCPDLNRTTTTISTVHNSTISSSNTMASSTVAVTNTETKIDSTVMEATINAMNTEATINSSITEVTVPSTIIEAKKILTSTEGIINPASTKATIAETKIDLTSTKPIISSTNTEATINSTNTEATINLTSTEETINSTITTVTINSKRTETTINPNSSEAATKLTSTIVPTSVFSNVPIINSINSTKSVSILTTCTSLKTSLKTEVIATTVATTPKDKEMVRPECKENEKVTDGSLYHPSLPKTSQDKCAYPKHCNRPSTWETTAEGETRDFYQIIRAQFGDRVRLLRDTTHFSRRFAKDFRANDEGFQFGYHNERMNEI